MSASTSQKVPIFRSRKAISGLAVLLVFAIVVVSAPTIGNSWDRWRGTSTISSELTQLDSPVAERTETNLVALDDGRVFQWAGRGAVNDGVIFDPSTNTFEELPTPSDLGRAAASTVWTGEEVIVWGGTTGKQETTVTKGGVAYDPTEKRWRTISDAPVGLSHAPAQFVDGQVLIAGGRQTQKEPTSLLYDVKTDAWNVIPIDVHIQTMFNFDGRIIGAGTLHMPGSEPEWQLTEFDSESQTWTSLGQQLQSDRLLPFVVDDQVGAVSLNHANNPGQVLVLSGDEWTEKKELPSSYADSIDPSSLYFWADWTGDALVFSGNSKPLRYDPATDTFGLFDQQVDISGPAVWNGDQLVALAPQSSSGWALKPSEN